MARILSDAEERTITFNGGSVTVRRLSHLEMAHIGKDVAPQIARIFDRRFQSDPRRMLNDSALLDEIVTLFLRFAPSLVARAIAVAADEPEKEELALTLPIDVQLAALEQIAQLSIRGAQDVRSVVFLIAKTASASSAAISRKRH